MTEFTVLLLTHKIDILCLLTPMLYKDCNKIKLIQEKSTASSSFEGDYCPCCHEMTHQDAITCDICRCLFHKNCTGLSSEVCEALLEIIQQTGWVCQDCRTQHHSLTNSLNIALTRVNEELADMRVSMAWLKNELDDLKSLKCNTSVSQNHLLNPTPAESSAIKVKRGSLIPVSDVSIEIHRTIADISRRKCNVVITGLPETADDDNTTSRDKDAFTQLCESHLPIKPALAGLGCKRLGKRLEPKESSGQEPRPRRLLVHLTSEVNAAELLAAAKQLRRSEDPHVASQIFINPDLTPTEAKLAYEHRQRRRETQNSHRHQEEAQVHESEQPIVTENENNNSGEDTRQISPPSELPFQNC